MLRNFLRGLRDTGSLYERHSKHPPASQIFWRRHRQWDFSILLTRFFLLPVPSFSGTSQSGIYWNTCEVGVGEPQNLWCGGSPAAESCHTATQHLCPGAHWGTWTFLLNGPRISSSSSTMSLTTQSSQETTNILTRIILKVAKLTIATCLTVFPVLVHCR